ncbi:MAG TPA: type II toxin-antitoxin system RelE/ParE family toxin [Acidobacteriaceae bacterium]|jgi:mRNA-degrading endonuclease RelE of RelBE toxin-antitoxin system|nr:type II toxin-antitoxin system RelE/ParE family toxin [Acidobacteriaceae bacterium]
MSKKIEWTAQARADLRAVDRTLALRILHALARLVQIGEGDVKRLQDIDPPEFRLRIGDYRLRFHDAGESIVVLSVKNRRDAYR